MKIRKSVISTISILLLSILLLSCASNSTAATMTTGKVEKGTLKVDISASGNLALAQTADLAFDVSGYVYKVYVEVGDRVKKGDVVAEVDPSDWDSQKVTYQKAVIQGKISVNDAQISLENAQNPTSSSSSSGAVTVSDPLEIESKQYQLEMAKMNLESSQKELDRYLATTYNIVAPFDGIVTAVNVKGGAEIYKGSVAVTIADPAKFKAEIYVNELDIGDVEIGMPATVELTASSTSSFDATVTKIAPTGMNSSGVVSYKVTVELSEAQPATTSTATQTAQQPAAGSASSMPPQSSGSGTLPASGQGTPPAGGQPPSGQASAETTQSEQLTLEDLKDGYSATITITIQQKENALMVLSKAISRQGGKSVVKIPKGSDKTEAVTVKTGISNDEYTEITSGLTEGQEYVISSSSTTKTSSSSSAAGMMQMGGGGGSPPSGGGGPGGGF